MAECSVTFSAYLAVADLPAFGIVAGTWYWVSDQTVTDDATGNPVRMLGHRFLQRQDEDDGINRPLFAGNAYLTYRDCETLGTGGVIVCEKGACVLNDECCYITFEGLCEGVFLGENTVCPALPPCFGIGACCNALLSDCFNSFQSICDQFDGNFLLGESCEDLPEPCIGACCAWEQGVGLGCFNGFSPTECSQLPGAEGFENITHTVWQGPGSVCDGSCPGQGACCTDSGSGCSIETPDDCLTPSVFMGLGTNCADEGICGGACCFFDPLGGVGNCFDVADPSVSCVTLLHTFLGPGTSCEDNAGDCGVCCLVNPADGTIICDTSLSQSECLDRGGTPFGPGSQCEICDTVTRACCILTDPLNPPCETLGWECVPVMNQAECLILGGIFRHDRTCAQFPCIFQGGGCCCPAGVCPDPPCHEPDIGDFCTCTDTLEQDCPQACNWVGPGRDCATTDPGPFPPIRPMCTVDCEQHCPDGPPGP